MNENNLILQKPQLQIYTVALFLLWSALIGIALFWSITDRNEELIEKITATARITHYKDVIFRRWASMHGGVYVPVTETTVPNIHLEDIAERDIVTPSGRKLTLMNPAYMTRQMYELAEKDSNMYGHITSLNPIRPENKPDAWEEKALKRFENGDSEVTSTERIQGKRYLRLMRPLKVEAECLKCHKKQGYKLGDIRGGISVSIPFKYYESTENQQIINIWLRYLLLWFGGLIGIVITWYLVHLQMKNLLQTQLKLQSSEQQLMEINATKDKFFSIIAHDLKNPFTQILGFSDLLLTNHKRYDEAKREKMLQAISTATKNTYSLLENLLEWANIQRGKIEIKPVTISIQLLIDEILQLVELQAHAKQITIKHEIEKSDLFADEKIIHTVLRNLISNAIKFTENGGTITIKVKNINNIIEFSVNDTGIGMSESELEKLFKPEQHFSKAGTANEKGTGLGLLLCKDFVELHGGKIWVESTKGIGSTFYFCISKKTLK